MHKLNVKVKEPAKKPPGPPPAGRDPVKWTLEDARRALAELQLEDDRAQLRTRLEAQESEASTLRATQDELLVKIAHATRAAQDSSAAFDEQLRAKDAELKTTKAALNKLRTDHRLALELIVTLGGAVAKSQQGVAAAPRQPSSAAAPPPARRRSLQPVRAPLLPPPKASTAPATAPDKPPFVARLNASPPRDNGPTRSIPGAAQEQTMAHRSPTEYERQLRERVEQTQRVLSKLSPEAAS